MTDQVAQPWKFYTISFKGRAGSIYSARDEQAAVALAQKDFMDKTGHRVGLAEFRNGAVVVTCRLPKHDRLELIRRRFGINPRLHQRVILRREHLAPKGGLILFPPKVNMAVFTLLLDGRDEPVMVDPNLVELID